VDGWGEVDATIAYAAVTRPISTVKGAGEWRLFFLQYEDWRNVVKTDNRPLAVRRADTGRLDISTVGGNYLRVMPSRIGPIDLLVWGAVQAGNWGVLAQRSGALSLEAGYQPSSLAGRLWFRGGYDFESGDDNPSDGTHGTFFQVLPTPRVYARTPFYNSMNLRDGFGQVIARPHKNVSLRGDVHSLTLSTARDLWYQGGGAYQPWTFGYVGRPASGHTGLATFFDLSTEWQATAHVTVTGYIGAARGGAVVESIYPRGKGLHFGYLEMLYRF
jgi:hypothetical protein